MFLKLGLTSFGGPVAHLVYFRRELVEKRQWVSDGQYAQLLALCQFLPGPASSQVGFSLGLMRAGWLGAFLAFVAFTLPSALLLVAFALFLPRLDNSMGLAAIQGLKLVALAVVAQGVVGMARKLCPDTGRRGLAILAALAIIAVGQAWMQIVVVVLGGMAGWWLCRDAMPPAKGGWKLRYGPRLGFALGLTFLFLLLVLPIWARSQGGLAAVVEAFYRAGALVFGGGHVVLPLLEEAVVAPGWVSSDDFLAGYGAAQAVPGPMFSLSAYLGARIPGAGSAWVGAPLALVAMFLPGFLLVSGALPAWRVLAGHPGAARVIAGVNAAVVGLLAAALYDPIWKTGVRGPVDLVIAAVAMMLLMKWRLSALWVVAWCVLASLSALALG